MVRNIAILVILILYFSVFQHSQRYRELGKLLLCT
uniref:Uncharacterized protein n=1 Tax=Arundo donax TaxID=35708 RepID=A0A0A9A4F2_ARUDO